ncbi:MAG: SurA N-terminal domain-containing protein [Akkermansiaceae bacterium]
MRKYTGLMAVVFVLLGAGFLFTMNSFNNTSGRGGGQTVLEVDGQSLDNGDYDRMSYRTLQLCDEIGLGLYSNLLLVPDHRQLSGALQNYNYFRVSYHQRFGRGLQRSDFNRFLAKRLILQNAMEEFGIYADDAEVFDAIQKLPAFTTREGKFNAEAFNTFKEKRLGKLGLTQKELYQVVRENLCLTKLVQIIGGGLQPPRSAAQASVDAQNQIITLAKVEFKKENFTAAQKPTEEEVKAYWEETKDNYTTDERRRISYVLLNLPPAAKEDAVTPPANETPEAKKAREEAEAKARDAKALARKEAGKKLKKQINEIYKEVVASHSSKKPLDFPAIVAEKKQQLVKTELFSQENLPAALKELTLRNISARGQSLGENIFRSDMGSDDYERLSEPLPVGEHGWVIYLLEEVESPTLLDFEAAKKEVREALIEKNATASFKQAAKDGRAAILEAMKAGKDFDTAAREKGFTPVQVGPFSLKGTPPKDEPNFRELHSLASRLNPGEVSEVQDGVELSFFIYVDKREIEDSEESKTRVDNEIDGGKSDLMIRTFVNWMNSRYKAAKVSGPAAQ